MRALLGWLTFLLSAAFLAGLIRILILNAWFDFPNERAVLGFFAFGIPTIVVAGATSALWAGYEWHLKFLGWAGTVAGIGCGVAVLLLVAAWILPERPVPVSMALIGRLLGFGTAAMFCGGFGIAMLFTAEGKSAPSF